jgi:hypothetical protein
MEQAQQRTDIRGLPIGRRIGNGGGRRREMCVDGHSMADGYPLSNGGRRCRHCKCAYERSHYQARRLARLGGEEQRA